jgi:hypothetical protein
MNITYIDENNISDDPVIILASEDVHELNLPNSRSLVVVQEVSLLNFKTCRRILLYISIYYRISFFFLQNTDENFMSCELEMDENSSFVSKS